MSELGELLELLHGARNRFRTVRATIRRWHHTELSERAVRHAFRDATRYGPVSYQMAGDPRAEPLEEYEELVRLWWEKPDRVREEHEPRGSHGEPTTTVVDGDWWWHWSPSAGATSNDGDPRHRVGVEAGRLLLDPSLLIPAFDFELVGEAEHSGRAALRLRATPREVEDWHPPQLALGADEHELLVDRERGILLHALSLFEGEPFVLAEVLEIAFDEAFPPEVFRLELPPGETVRSALGPGVRRVSIEEAVRLAPFTVFIPSRVPAGWRMEVTYAPAEERPRIEAAVFVHYLPDDGTHGLTLNERAAGEGSGTALWGPLERVEHAGQEFLAWAPSEEDWPTPVQVVAEREGTVVHLSSDLPLERVLDLAASLVPAPAEPPRLSD